MSHRMWWKIDQASHWLHQRHLLPERIRRWICDRFDLSLGLTPEEMSRTADDWTAGGDALTERQIRDHMDRENWHQVEPLAEPPSREEGS